MPPRSSSRQVPNPPPFSVGTKHKPVFHRGPLCIEWQFGSPRPSGPMYCSVSWTCPLPLVVSGQWEMRLVAGLGTGHCIVGFVRMHSGSRISCEPLHQATRRSQPWARRGTRMFQNYNEKWKDPSEVVDSCWISRSMALGEPVLCSTMSRRLLVRKNIEFLIPFLALKKQSNFSFYF